MKDNVFSRATDGSNDAGLEKMKPLTVWIDGVNTSRLVTQFIDMCWTIGSSGDTAKSIFNKIGKVLRKCEITLCNCVGFSVDNTSTNMGIRNSIKSRALEKNDNCCFIGCPIHIHYNTAYGSSTFTKVSGVDAEDFRVNLYHFFDISFKRKSVLMEYTQFCNQEFRKILEHLNVRWQSLELAVDHLLKQYASLKSYFLSEKAPTTGGESDSKD